MATNYVHTVTIYITLSMFTYRYMLLLKCNGNKILACFRFSSSHTLLQQLQSTHTTYAFRACNLGTNHLLFKDRNTTALWCEYSVCLCTNEGYHVLTASNIHVCHQPRLSKGSLIQTVNLSVSNACLVQRRHCGNTQSPVTSYWDVRRQTGFPKLPEH
jgi:hypothetical protein